MEFSRTNSTPWLMWLCSALLLVALLGCGSESDGIKAEDLVGQWESVQDAPLGVDDIGNRADVIEEWLSDGTFVSKGHSTLYSINNKDTPLVETHFIEKGTWEVSKDGMVTMTTTRHYYTDVVSHDFRYPAELWDNNGPEESRRPTVLKVLSFTADEIVVEEQEDKFEFTMRRVPSS